MGKYQLGICIFAAFLIYGATYPVWFWIAAINAGVSLWSFGIMWNFRHNPLKAPNLWSAINLVTSIARIGLLVYGVILNLKTYP